MRSLGKQEAEYCSHFDVIASVFVRKRFESIVCSDIAILTQQLLISINGFGPSGKNPDNFVWCLSAGPNFNVDTPAYSTYVRMDDIGYRAE